MWVLSQRAGTSGSHGGRQRPGRRRAGHCGSTLRCGKCRPGSAGMNVRRWSRLSWYWARQGDMDRTQHGHGRGVGLIHGTKKCPLPRRQGALSVRDCYAARVKLEDSSACNSKYGPTTSWWRSWRLMSRTAASIPALMQSWSISIWLFRIRHPSTDARTGDSLILVTDSQRP